jgi:hypothetical protein
MEWHGMTWCVERQIHSTFKHDQWQQQQQARLCTSSSASSSSSANASCRWCTRPGSYRLAAEPGAEPGKEGTYLLPFAPGVCDNACSVSKATRQHSMPEEPNQAAQQTLTASRHHPRQQQHAQERTLTAQLLFGLTLADRHTFTPLLAAGA